MASASNPLFLTLPVFVHLLGDEEFFFAGGRQGRSTAAGLGLSRGDRIPRVIGPGVLGIAALHVLLHLLVSAVPEPLQILGDLHRPAGRGEEMEKDLYPSAGYFRR